MKFAINGQAGLGPHLFEKETFAPAGVRNDDIGAEAISSEFSSGFEAGLRSDHLGFEICHPRVDGWGGTAAGPIAVLLHALPGGRRGLGHQQG